MSPIVGSESSDPSRESSPDDLGTLETGAVFGGRFQVHRLIGRGSMGRVYDATDMETGGAVALKVLKPDRAPDSESRERFRREARVLSSMTHPGVVRIHGYGYAVDGTPWLAMERLHGETLLDRVRRRGALEPSELLPIVEASCDALEAAHAQGVIHRDLKPENIFLPEGGEPAAKILDFGLSLAVGGVKLTHTGAILGTPRYMAPEQIRSAHAADGRVDVYALGVIIYEAVAGRSPFTASDQGQLLGAIFAGRVEALSEVRPDLPPGVETVLADAMATDREARLASPHALARAVDDALAGRDVNAERSSRRATAKAKPVRRRWPWWLLAIAVGIAVVALAGSLGAALVEWGLGN